MIARPNHPKPSRPAETAEQLAKARRNMTLSADLYARQVGIALAFEAEAGAAELVERSLAGMSAAWEQACTRRHEHRELANLESMTPREVVAWRLDFGQTGFFHAVYDALGVVPYADIDEAFARLSRLMIAVRAPQPGGAAQ